MIHTFNLHVQICGQGTIYIYTIYKHSFSTIHPAKTNHPLLVFHQSTHDFRRRVKFSPSFHDLRKSFTTHDLVGINLGVPWWKIMSRWCYIVMASCLGRRKDDKWYGMMCGSILFVLNCWWLMIKTIWCQCYSEEILKAYDAGPCAAGNLRYPPFWLCSTSSILNLGEGESSIKSPPKNIQKAAPPESFENKPVPTCVVFLHHHHDDLMSFEVDERWSSSSWSEWRSEADGGESWMKEVRRHATRYLGCTKNGWKTWRVWVWLKWTLFWLVVFLQITFCSVLHRIVVTWGCVGLHRAMRVSENMMYL